MFATLRRLVGLFMLILASPLIAAVPGIKLPEVLRQGDPCVATILVPLKAIPQIKLLLPGRPVPQEPSAWPAGTQDGLARFLVVFAVGLDSPPGKGSLTMSYPAPLPAPVETLPYRSILSLESSFQVTKRSVKQEEIELTSAMDNIKTAIDPKRDEQIRRYAAVLAMPHADAIYLDGTFEPPVASQRHTAWFGDQRVYRYLDGKKESSQHWGSDFGIPSGTPVFAPARGRVVLAEDRISTGWTIILEHLPGMFTIYMHLSVLKVELGQVVETKQLIAESGATGFATGPHLHWELRIGGMAADPEALLAAPPGSQRFMP